MASPQRVSADSARILIVEPNPVIRFWRLFERACVASFEDNCFSIAKGAAYSFLFSLFPVLTALTSILVQVRAQAVVHVIARFAMEVVPPGTEDLILSRLRDRGGKPITLPILALVISLWAGSGAMMSLMEGFQAAYRIPAGRSFLKQRAMGIFLVLVAAVPGVLASVLILSGDNIEKALVHQMGLIPEGRELTGHVELAWRVSRYVLAFCTTTLVTGLLYYFGPNHRPELFPEIHPRSRFMRVWPGAFLATTLWMLATLGFAWYVGHRISSYNVFYGSLGAVIVLLIWLYLIACISLIGCEFNAERERLECVAGSVCSRV